MKLRLRGNSLRLRLSQTEVATLARTGRVEESVAFAPGQRFAYVLAFGDAATLSACFSNGTVAVSVPAALAREWAASDRVGLEAQQPIGADEVLRILVEKDFACLRPRTGEDDGDAFPNPNESC